MKLLVQLLLSLFILNPVFGQVYNTNDIIYKADSILQANVSDSISKYTKLRLKSNADQQVSSYSYNSRSGFTYLAWLEPNETTEKRFVDATVVYEYKYPAIEKIGEITGFFYLRFDENLVCKDTLSDGFIPDFILEDRPCDFILADKALELCRDSFYQGINDPYALLLYDRHKKKHIYHVEKLLKVEMVRVPIKWYKQRVPEKKRKTMLAKRSDSQILEVDALTGEILSNGVFYTGPFKPEDRPD